jgi:hypothetical protein
MNVPECTQKNTTMQHKCRNDRTEYFQKLPPEDIRPAARALPNVPTMPGT